MESSTTSFKEYLEPTRFIDYNTPVIQNFVSEWISEDCDTNENVIRLYYTIRDLIEYNLDEIFCEPSFFNASKTLERGTGFCIPKAILLAAAARAIGVPARLGFVDVTNHIASEKAVKRMGTNLFVFHSYTDLYMNEKWVKATPAFNKELCEKFGVEPLEFDGTKDSLFQQFDKKGNEYMEYVYDHGVFVDLPYDLMMTTLEKAYPRIFEEHCNTLNEKQ
ncbi:MAG: transglutaminase family protein [Cytophagales bacterium]|nr:transglutaminase family protein [Cytophagales bacterium]